MNLPLALSDGNHFDHGRPAGASPETLAQQAAARAFAVDHRGGTTQVQVNRRDRVLLQFASSPDQGRDIVADDLRHDGAARGVVGDGPQDVADVFLSDVVHDGDGAANVLNQLPCKVPDHRTSALRPDDAPAVVEAVGH